MSGFEGRFFELDAFLCETAWLWRPMPFKECRPLWCEELPELARGLLALPDDQAQKLGADPAAALRLIGRFLPDPMAQLERLSRLESCALSRPLSADSHLRRDIPGRKLQQIEAFASAIGSLAEPALEWCGGKGHLGRLLAASFDLPVCTLDHDAQLCAAGSALAQRSRVEQRFELQDILALDSLDRFGRHSAIALHACGELHQKLVGLACPEWAAQLHVSPCCYHLTRDEHYHAASPRARLVLSAADRRLAVTETVTSSQREVYWRDREMAWKLGYIRLREDLLGSAAYMPIAPVAKSWLRGSFEQFCGQLAQRDGLDLADVARWNHYEQAGEERRREVVRLSLLRQAFRRVLELWLVFDLALRLEAKSYSVAVSTFCEPGVTPRNILISARA